MWTKQTRTSVLRRLTLLLGLIVLLSLTNGCAPLTVPGPQPVLPQMPSVTMPPTSTQILQSVEQNMLRWEESQQKRQSRLMESLKDGPDSPSGQQPKPPL